MPRVPVVLALLLPFALTAQTVPGRDTTMSVRDSAIKLFVDCADYSHGCDKDFFRAEITFVNYTYNPQDADVHALITTTGTGGGGTEYTVTLIGQHQFAGRADTLRYDAPPASAADDDRRGVAQLLRLGLVGYAATTPLAARLHVSYDAPKGAAAVVHDPWNYWVFSTQVNGYLNGQQSVHSGFVYGSVTANRTTERWKLSLGLNYDYNETNYKLPVYDTLGNQTGTETISSFTRGYGANLGAVKSMGRHWGVGGKVVGSSSSYSNQRLRIRAAPGVEYDFFPYSQSTRQLITLHYEVGVTRVNYYAETLYGKHDETLWDETLTLATTAKETWGNVSLSLEAANYLPDVSKHHFTLYGSTNLNLYRGLSFNISGDVSLQHDQLSLPLQGASAQEVLLQQHQLASSFYYFASIGFSFNFGSIFNNVVNPRFGGSGGGSGISF